MLRAVLTTILDAGTSSSTLTSAFFSSLLEPMRRVSRFHHLLSEILGAFAALSMHVARRHASVPAAHSSHDGIDRVGFEAIDRHHDGYAVLLHVRM